MTLECLSSPQVDTDILRLQVASIGFPSFQRQQKILNQIVYDGNVIYGHRVRISSNPQYYDYS